MKKYDDTFKAVVLGALLHDIGKFWQRADGEINYQKSSELSSQTKNNIGNICPFRNDNYSHKHALWTNEFFERHEFFFRNLIDNYASLGNDNPANLASYHHSPSTALQTLIQQADWLSSGVDRIKTKDIEDEEKITGYRFRKVRLQSIFGNIALTREKVVDRQYYYNIEPFRMDEKYIFPVTKENLAPPLDEDLNEKYATLWNDFIKEFERGFEQKKHPNFYLLVDALLSLLEKYTWCIPSSTSDLPDISLYDHLRTTAGIAACLYEYHKNQGQFTKEHIKEESSEKFLLVGGDLSGIQTYIFDLVHTNLKRVSKTLRARSFYLSMLPKIIVIRILYDNDLTPANNLMETGGRFILLLPNTEKIKTYLRDFNNSLGEWCLNEFYGELTVNLDWQVTLSGGDFKNQRFREKLEQLNHHIEVKKLQKFGFKQEMPWEDNGFVVGLEYEKIAGDGELCNTCGKRRGEEKDWEGEKIRICNSCWRQAEVGQELTRGNILSITFSPAASKPGGGKPGFEFLSGDHRLYLNLHREYQEVKHHSGLITCYRLDESETPGDFLPRSFIANHVPRFNPDEIGRYKAYYQKISEKSEEYEHIKPGAIKTFNDIAIPENKLSDDATNAGVHYLAIVKADVDNLGLIFSAGLGQNLSISRYATLSRMMNGLFCGYLDTYLEEHFPNIYTVYAGGDDLFLIGNWKDILDFAPRFNAKFRAYSCNNVDVHLSAGIEIIKPRSPIRKGAERAEHSLDEAKSSKRRGEKHPPKNKLYLFRYPLQWEKWDSVEDWVQFFDRRLSRGTEDREEKSKINPAFLYRLLLYRSMALRHLDAEEVEGLLYLSLLSYDIARNIEQRDRNEQLLNKDEVEKLRTLIDIKDKEKMRTIHIPIFYTLYKNRGGRDE